MAYFEVNKKPPLSFPSVSGSIVTFNAQYALPLKSHTVAVTATQSGSGTPSPQNIRSINGYSNIRIRQIAVCVIDQQFELGGYRSTDGAKYNANDRLRSVNRYPVKPNMEFYLSMPTSGMWVYEYNINGTFINRYQLSAGNTYTVHTGAYQIALEIYGSYGTTYNNDISLNYPSTDSSYHDYQGTYTTIQIGSTYYGGTYNAITGILSVTHGFVTYDSNNVPFMQIGTISGGVKTRVFIRQSGVSQTVSGVPDMLCNIANPVEVNAQYQGNEGIAIRVNANVNNQGFYIYNEDIQTLTEWQDYINNNSITVVYPLATPQTIQLPPCPIDTLEGVNNIWADTGDTILQYPKFG